MNLKVIYIHKRPYPYSKRFFEELNDNYFYFGEGPLYINNMNRVILKKPIEFEVWRGEVGIDQVREKVVNNSLCRIFPAKYYRTFGIISKQLLKTIKKESKKNKILIHYTASPHSMELYFILLMNHHVPIFVNHQGGANPYWKYKQTGNIKSLLASFSEKIVYQWADLFFTTSKEEAYYLNKQTNSNKVVTEPHWGVNFNYYFPIDRTEAKSQIGIDPNKKVILVAGKLSYYRGIKDAVAVKNLIKKHFDVELINIGSDKTDDEYKYAKENGVRLYGWIPFEQVHKYFSAADVYFYLVQGQLNIDFAGIGIAPLEALACNTPVVTNTLHHFPRIYEENCGIYANDVESSAKAITEILQNPGKYNNTRDFVIKHFNWKNIVNKVVRKYDEYFEKYYK